ncbi:glycosyltransferase family 2 protein [Lacticaseibacillus suilingensis]|uniref:Glycosyltransferase family 2 protein n=1 Tax=Lacticaseibacillus suilingensis TaxID=2799577 RepID=A0ABW4BJ86_9LACO|nr:glycosyltransferase family 2 protein [Lacticaseibacillus suilingensis]
MTTNSFPKLSIIIPTFRRKDYLKQAINSILQQNEESFEIIVVDDDPKSINGQWIDEMDDVRVLYHVNSNNSGPGYCRKFGLEMARAPYVIFMDDDDFYTDNNFFKKSLKLFSDVDESVAFIAFNAYTFDEETGSYSKSGSLNRQGLIERRLLLKKFMGGITKPKSTFTCVFKRLKLLESRVVDVKMLNDTVIYFRALTVGNAYFSSEYIGSYRLHKSNISKTLSADFIVENLNEKVAIAGLLPFSGMSAQNWLAKQAYVSIQYFYNENQSVENDQPIRRWLFNNNMYIRINIWCRLQINARKRNIKCLMERLDLQG